jgi:hypothetical protein
MAADLCFVFMRLFVCLHYYYKEKAADYDNDRNGRESERYMEIHRKKIPRLEHLSMNLVASGVSRITRDRSDPAHAGCYEAKVQRPKAPSRFRGILSRERLLGAPASLTAGHGWTVSPGMNVGAGFITEG